MLLKPGFIFESKKKPELELPLVEFTLKILGDVDLSNICIIAAQHILPSTHSMIRSWFKLGLKKNNIAVIGKCYSTQPEIYFKMLNDRIDVCSSSLDFDPCCPYDDFFKKNIRTFLKRKFNELNLKAFQKVIFLDDGGVLITEALKLKPDADNFIGVEQTSSGYYLLEKKMPSFPIVNVARSEAKLNYESPIICSVISDKLFAYLDGLAEKDLNILIIGNGAIGSNLAQIITNKFQILIYDINKEKSHIKKSEFEKSLMNADIVIGCTGKTILNEQHFNLFKNQVLLISTSSSDREFSGSQLRKEVSGIFDCHEDVKIGNINLINCGFPINFDRNFDSVDPEIFQFTRSLLTLGVLQAALCDHKDEGFLSLDLDAQAEIIKKFKELYHINYQSVGVM